MILKNTTIEEIEASNNTVSEEMTEIQLNTTELLVNSTVEEPKPLDLLPFIGTWGREDLLIHLNSFDSGLIGTGNPAFFKRAYGLKMNHDSTFAVHVLNSTAIKFGGNFTEDWTHSTEGNATFILSGE